MWEWEYWTTLLDDMARNRFDPNWITQFVETDIEIARRADKLTPVKRPDDNFLWEKILNRI